MIYCSNSHEPSVSFDLYLPNWKNESDISALCISYRAADHKSGRRDPCIAGSSGSKDVAGTLRLTRMRGRAGRSAGYLWELDGASRDFAWLTQTLIGWGWTRQSELESFLGRCFQTAVDQPDRPFRAVFV